MLAGADLRPGDVVLEYGPGTGSLTRPIRRLLHAVGGVGYLGIEREPGFTEILRREMPELTFVTGRVEDVERLLVEHHLPPPKLVVSGLPLILMQTMEPIVATTAKILAGGGSFRTFSYVHSYPAPSAARLRRLMRTHFDRFSIRGPVARNLPPALVLRGDVLGTGAAAAGFVDS